MRLRSLLWKGVRTEPLLSASWTCLFSPHDHTPTERLWLSLQGKSTMAADGSIAKRKVTSVFDSVSEHARGGDAALAETQTRNQQKSPPSKNTQPLGSSRLKCPKIQTCIMSTPEFGKPGQRARACEEGDKQKLRWGRRWGRRLKVRNRAEWECWKGRRNTSWCRLSPVSNPKSSMKEAVTYGCSRTVLLYRARALHKACPFAEST